MPIKPENMKLYPGGSIRSSEWRAIRERIKARAGDCCEQCGVRNHAFGYRGADGTFVDLGMDRGEAETAYIEQIYMTSEDEASRLLQIICTVAHLDRGLADHSDANLRFWCQRCHNLHDMPDRRMHAKATRDAKIGQGALFP